MFLFFKRQCANSYLSLCFFVTRSEEIFTFFSLNKHTLLNKDLKYLFTVINLIIIELYFVILKIVPTKASFHGNYLHGKTDFLGKYLSNCFLKFSFQLIGILCIENDGLYQKIHRLASFDVRTYGGCSNLRKYFTNQE